MLISAGFVTEQLPFPVHVKPWKQQCNPSSQQTPYKQWIKSYPQTNCQKCHDYLQNNVKTKIMTVTCWQICPKRSEFPSSYIFNGTASNTIRTPLHRAARVTEGAAGVRGAIFVVVSTLSTDLLWWGEDYHDQAWIGNIFDGDHCCLWFCSIELLTLE